MIHKLEKNQIRCYGNILDFKSNKDCTGNYLSSISFTNNLFIMNYNITTYEVETDILIENDEYFIEIDCNVGNIGYEVYLNYILLSQNQLDENGYSKVSIPNDTLHDIDILIKIQSSEGYNEYTTIFTINDYINEGGD